MTVPSKFVRMADPVKITTDSPVSVRVATAENIAKVGSDHGTISQKSGNLQGGTQKIRKLSCFIICLKKPPHILC